MNNNEEIYALVEKQFLWLKDVKAGTRVLKHELAGTEEAKVRE